MTHKTKKVSEIAKNTPKHWKFKKLNMEQV